MPREAFERYQADAITLNPYLGGDALAPFLAYQDKGAFHPVPHLQPRQRRDSTTKKRRPVNRPPHRHPGSHPVESKQQCRPRSRRHLAARNRRDPQTGRRHAAVDPRNRRPRAVIFQAVLANGLTPDGAGVLINASRSIIHAGGRRRRFCHGRRPRRRNPVPRNQPESKNSRMIISILFVRILTMLSFA